MALIVEDGTIVANANSYVTEDEYIEWSGARFGYDRPTSSVTPSQAILRAMDAIESFEFIGYRTSQTQPLKFPRTTFCIGGYVYGKNQIPPDLKLAVFEMAWLVENGKLEKDNIKRMKLENIEEEYFADRGTMPMPLMRLLEFKNPLKVFRA